MMVFTKKDFQSIMCDRLRWFVRTQITQPQFIIMNIVLSLNVIKYNIIYRTLFNKQFYQFYLSSINMNNIVLMKKCKFDIFIKFNTFMNKFKINDWSVHWQHIFRKLFYFKKIITRMRIFQI